jgi:ABC-type transport system involved in Fe-S cluster assembly fused permease/ATPase subunit
MHAGEVTKTVDRGTAAIQNVLSTILFQILPQVCDQGRLLLLLLLLLPALLGC